MDLYLKPKNQSNYGICIEGGVSEYPIFRHKFNFEVKGMIAEDSCHKIITEE